MDSVIFRITARSLLPLMLLFSVFLLLRGHHEPGGGFTGGLVAASGFALYAIAFDAYAAYRALRLQPQTIIGWGLLIALVSGFWGMVSGHPFLTGVWGTVMLPVIGKVKLGTPLLFDIGVYLVVIGVTLMIILSLAQQEEN